MDDFRSALHSRIAQRRTFLAHDRAQIAVGNATALAFVAGAATCLMALFLAAGPAPAADGATFAVRAAALVVVAVLAVVFAAARRRIAQRASTALSVGAAALLYLSAIAVDAFGCGGLPGYFLQLICIALCALVVLPAPAAFGLPLGTEALFVALSATVKSPAVAQLDAFSALGGLLLGLGAGWVIMGIRLASFSDRLQFEQLSERDALSNLYNKRAFTGLAEAYCTRHRPHLTCMVAIIDFDDFKDINDTLGHEAGDKVLATTGELLRHTFRPTDVVARFGGDEFTVLADGLAHDDVIRARFDSFDRALARAMRASYGRDGSCSVGVGVAQDADASFDELFACADAALYEAKRAGKRRVVIRALRHCGEADASPTATGDTTRTESITEGSETR